MSLSPGFQSPETQPQTDDRLRERGLEMVTLISAVIRVGRAYSVTNQVFRAQLEKISEALRPVLELGQEAVFVALGDDLYLNGVRIQINASNFRFHRTVIEIFRSRSIAGIRFERGVQTDDLGRFFSLFLSATAPHGAGLLKACAEQDMTRVLPVVHATTDSTAHGGDGGLAGVDPGPEPLSQVFGGAAGESGDESQAPRSGWRHSQALSGARALLTPTTLNAGLQMRHAKRVVQPLVDGAFSSEPVVVGLASLTDYDEYTYAHAVNVSAIAVTMGHFLGMDRRTLADLGVAALLHDVGKSAVVEHIFHPLEGFDEEERQAAERHPLEGAKLLARSTSLNPTTLRCIRVALEHHASPDAGGAYPKLPPRWRIGLISQVVAVADCYVNLHSRCGDLIERISPYEALGMMFGRLRDRFEPALLWALVQSVGLYPPGQVVELDDGSIAQVLAPNKHDLARPFARRLAGPGGRPLASMENPDLLPIPRELSVQRALTGTQIQRWENLEEAA